MMTAKFTATRTFQLRGRIVKSGDLVESDDFDEVRDLLNTGLIAAADAATAGRIQSKVLVEWLPAAGGNLRPLLV